MERVRRFLVYVLLVALNLVVYGQVYDFAFVNYDDGDYVTENPYTQAPFTLHSLRWAFTTGYFNNWHPATWLSHMLDYQLFGLEPGGHHLVNLGFHILNSLLLFEILRRMTGALGPSALVAVLFAIHPLHVESVAWVSERKDILSTFFGLLALAGYLVYVKRPSVARYLLVAVPFACGLMAKSMLVTWPCVLLLLDYWPLRRIETKVASWRRIREKLPLFALSFAVGIVALFLRTSPTASFGASMANASVNYLRYLVKTFYPAGLTVFYPHPGDAIVWPHVVCATGILAAITALAIVWARRRPFFLVGWLWYLGTMAPAIGAVQIGLHGMADRYTYIPLIGIFIIIAWGISERARSAVSKRAVVALATVAVLGMTVVAFFQVQHWRNSTTLFEHARSITPNSSIVHNNLGLAFMEDGRIPEAIDQYEKAIELDPACAKAHNNLGIVLEKLDKPIEAIQHYREAIQTDPDYAAGHYNLGTFLAKQGKPEEAVAEFLETLRIQPDNAQAHYNLATALTARGRLEEAAHHYAETIRLMPDFRDAYLNLGVIAAKQARFEEAFGYYQKALELDPQCLKACNDIGNLFYASGRYDEAAAYYGRALEIDPSDKTAREALARISARRGGVN